MNRINMRNYRGANIQYTCEDCIISDNFYVEFSNVPKVKPGGCEHFNINFLLVMERNDMKYLLSFTCKNCKENKIIELFNNNTNSIDGNIFYSCTKCGQGKITAGFLLGDNLFDNDDEDQEEEHNKHQTTQLALTFHLKENNYNVNVDVNILLPEAFRKACEINNRKDLENLDIQFYKKGDNTLSQFKTIKELNLNNGDIIEIIERGNCNWENN